MPKPDPVGDAATARSASGVHSLQRAFELLESMAAAGGMLSLSELSERVGIPKPTAHRLVRTLVELGYVRQEPSRAYALGPKLVRLGDGAGRMLGLWATPHLRKVVDFLGESANLTVLEGDYVVEVCQVPGRHSMRMVSEIGARAMPHCTAAGKAMLSALRDEQAEAIVRRTGMPQYTPATITDPAAYLGELASIRQRGSAIADEEQEFGVRCVALVVPGGDLRAAVSISGPLTRMTDDLISQAVPMLSLAAKKLAAEFYPYQPVTAAP